jgi:TatA/E family protein of Tat protein translocase
MSAAALAFAAAPAPALAFLEGIGAMEMVLVAIIGLLLFGGKGLPDMARTVGKVVREFKKATANVENEVKRVMNEEPTPAPKPRPRPRAAPTPAAPATLPEAPRPDSPPPEAPKS